jgi:AcrR family transcriptional regulator
MGRSRAARGARDTAAGAAGQATKERILDGVIETIKQHGILGASARAIARTAGVTEPLLFYHFGTLDKVLLAAVDEVNIRRLASHRPRLEAVTTLPELVAVGAEIYAEDRRAGYTAVLVQTLAGFAASPELSRALLDRFKPWIRLLEATLTRITSGTPYHDQRLVKDVAVSLTAWFVGMELLSHLDDQPPGQALLQHLHLATTALLPNTSGDEPGTPPPSTEQQSHP